ncbi:ATP-binding protein [Breznakiella homolactica]|uniref:ATP-binding protein n=1 Tax=Breznakiella homolactica TaxID=2798577 RepID=A0A7T7XQG1_9SPIR|nr:ATP-binding protein [Breznakiella homolactica]QQO10601.1 ATP-binding protein [Breznakiella homolactica]
MVYKRKVCIFSIYLLFIIPFHTLTAGPRQDRSGPYYTNLQQFPVYIREGFDREFTTKVPAGDLGPWICYRNDPENPGPLQIKNLDFPDIRNPHFLSPKRLPEREFTLLIPFSLNARQAIPGDTPPVLGVFLASLGDNWEIYLNGSLVLSEIHLDDAGRIKSHRAQRKVSFPLDSSIFTQGTNILAFRIVGDPNYKNVGFYYTSPYYIDEYTTIEKNHDELMTATLCGIYVFVGIYHFFVFLNRRRDLHNLYYSLFSVTLGTYLFARTRAAYGIIADTLILSHIELASLFMVVPFIGAFIESLCIQRVRKFTMGYAAFFGLLAVLQMLGPPSFADDVLRIWQILALAVVIVYIFCYDIGYTFFSAGYRLWKQSGTGERFAHLLRIYRDLLINHPVGNLIIGTIILLATAVFDILDSMFFHYGIVLTQFGFFVFTIGTTLILARRYGFVYGQLNLANSNLEERVRDLTEANDRIRNNEHKYRSLFEGTSDPMLLLDETMHIKDWNTAAAGFYGLSDFDFDGSPDKSPTLPDRLYKDSRERDSTAERFRQYIRELKTSGDPVEVPASVKNPIGEFKNCILRMEYIPSLGGNEILVRARVSHKETMTEAYVEGNACFKIENTLGAADEVSRHARSRLSRYLPAEEADFAAICLREMVLNAIEHGNLEVSYDEKSEHQKNGTYFDFLEERMEDPRFRDRRVLVEYSINSRRAVFSVTDEGKGFDYTRYTSGRESAPDLLEHGRGILITLSAFDRVTYSGRGNQVTLEKQFTPEH